MISTTVRSLTLKKIANPDHKRVYYWYFSIYFVCNLLFRFIAMPVVRRYHEQFYFMNSDTNENGIGY